MKNVREVNAAIPAVKSDSPSTSLSKAAISRPSSATVVSFFRRWWFLAAAFALVYGPLLPAIVREWWTNDDYAHGLFTPFAIAYLAYERRKGFISIPPNPSGFGFLVILASQALLIVGFLGAEFFLQRISMLLFLAGAIVFLWGWEALSKTAFALVLILLAIPVPAVIFNSVALPLQLLASTMAQSVLDLLRISVYRDGNILQLPNGLLLNVAEACSGIRSLVTLIALSALMTMLARFQPLRWGARGVFVLSVVPIALMTNALRVIGTALLAFNYGEKAAQGFFHSVSGGLVFVIAFSILLVEMVCLQSPKYSQNRRAS